MAPSARPRWGFTRTEMRTLLLLAGLLLLGLAGKQVRRMTSEPGDVQVQGLAPVDSVTVQLSSPDNPGAVPRGSGSLAPSPSSDVTSALPTPAVSSNDPAASDAVSDEENREIEQVSGDPEASGDLARPGEEAELRYGKPSRGETTAPVNGGDGTFDLNTMTREQLESLPGIGPVLAGRILTWRSQHGAFSRVEDLLLVDGIGEKRLATLKAHVHVRP